MPIRQISAFPIRKPGRARRKRPALAYDPLNGQDNFGQGAAFMSTNPTDPMAAVAAFRFGFGLPMPAGAPGDAPAMLVMLAGPDPAGADYPPLLLADVIGVTRAAHEARVAAREDPTKAAYKEAVRAVEALAEAGFRTQIARALDSPDGLRERLVRFWADHFTVAHKNRLNAAVVAAYVDDAIRPHVAARFEDMLTAATLHPAMLIYLDQVASVGPASKFGLRQGKGLNENLARELLELHTLGAGQGYAQGDVRELAELLTGLRVDPAKGTVFDARRAEPGAETVLGVAYDGDGMDPIRAVLADLAVRPETARHVAGKLVTHFLTDEPMPDVAGALAKVWTDTGGDLAAVTGVMLDRPEFWDPGASKARNPMEFLIAALRAIGVTGAEVMVASQKDFRQLVLGPLAAMGQPMRGPAGPDGWPEVATDWITPQGMAARIDWAMRAPRRIRKTLPDPVALVPQVLGPRATERLTWAVARAESRPEALGLILAAPEFNRR